MNLIKKIVNNNYVFSVLTKVLLILIGVIFLSVKVRFLGQDLNGKLAYINSTCSILNTILVCGIHQGYTYYRKKYGQEFKGYYLGSVCMLFVVYLILSIVINVNLSLSVEDSIIIAILPAFFLTKIVRYVALVEQPKEKNKVELAVNVIQVIFVTVLYFLCDASIFWVLILALFHEVLCVVTYINKLKIKLKIGKDTIRLLGKLFVFGFLPMLSLLLNDLNYKVDVLMLKAGTTYAYVSIYTCGIALAEKCWAIPDAIRDILLSKLTFGGEKDEVTKIIRFSNTITLAMQIALALLGKMIIAILYGDGYEESYYILLIAMFGTYGMIYTKMINIYNLVEGRKVINTIFMFLVAVSNISINLVLIPIIGIYGAAIASVISYNLCGLLFAVDFKRKTGARFREMILVNHKDISLIKRSIKSKNV